MIKELAAENRDNQEIKQIFPEFYKAIELLNSENMEHQIVALRWIMGGKVFASTLRKLELEKCISDSDDAVRALACIVRMVGKSSKYNRIVWMIDEFQRVKSEKKGVYEDINTGLHSVYNASPNHLSIFLSFSVKEQKNMFSMLSKELIDRIGIQKIIAIPELSAKEAFVFVGDLLHAFREENFAAPSAFYPFDDDAVKFIISLIEKNSDIKPRSIMQYFNAVLEQADFRIARGEMRSIDIEFAKKILLNYDLFLSFQKESLMK